MAIEHKENEQGFMQRWSNRKIESTKISDNSLDKNNISEHKITELRVNDSAPVIHKADADMPPLEQLTETSDYSDFLSPGVSDALRKLALRKLFHLPLFNVVDELDDYAEDFTKFSSLGDIVPHDMKRMIEREKTKELEQQSLDNEERLSKDLNADVNVSDEEIKNAEQQLSNVNKADIERLSADELINQKDEGDNEKTN